MGELEDPRCRMEVERVLQEALGQPLTIVVATGEQRANGERSGEAGGGHLVRAAVGYGGQVINETSQPASAPSPASAPYVPDSPSAPERARDVDETSATPAPAPDIDEMPPAPVPASYADDASAIPTPTADTTANGATHVAEPEPEPANVPVSPDDANEPSKEWNDE